MNNQAIKVIRKIIAWSELDSDVQTIVKFAKIGIELVITSYSIHYTKLYDV